MASDTSPSDKFHSCCSWPAGCVPLPRCWRKHRLGCSPGQAYAPFSFLLGTPDLLENFPCGAVLTAKPGEPRTSSLLLRVPGFKEWLREDGDSTPFLQSHMEKTGVMGTSDSWGDLH